MKSDAGGKQMRDVWNIPTPPKREKSFGKHPTQKPLALLRRVVIASSKEDNMILDPFSGSSTTGIAAVLAGRNYIGIESDIEYLKLSVKRYKNAVRQRTLI